MLRSAEKAILKFVKTPYKGFYTDIGSVVGESDKIWTVALNETSKETPLVLLHGMGAGVALWVSWRSFLKAFHTKNFLTYLGAKFRCLC